MKYAKFSNDFLSYFRLDDNGETLVVTDKQGYTRAVKLLPYVERPQGEWVVQRLHNGFDDVYCPFCNARPTRSEYGYYLKDKFCHECGADMRKPNCVTCDHFGKCDGCERSDEE